MEFIYGFILYMIEKEDWRRQKEISEDARGP